MKFQDIKDIKNKIHELVENAYVMGYDDGLKDGKESVQIDETEAYKLGYENGLTCKEYIQIDESTAYRAGLETAWELARKLSNLGFNEKRKEIFGEKYGLSIDIIKNFSVDEVADKIKEYEEKQKMVEDAEIKVGDEVIYCGGGAHDGSVGVVLGTENGWREVRFKSCWNCVGVWKDSLTKTGRHFPQIEEVLEQLKGEEG